MTEAFTSTTHNHAALDIMTQTNHPNRVKVGRSINDFNGREEVEYAKTGDRTGVG